MSTPTPEKVTIRRAATAASDTGPLRRLASEATAVDGVAPFNDDTMLGLDARGLLAIDGADDALEAAALTRSTDEGLEAEFVVHPRARRRGLGARLLAALRERGPATAWAHGDLPAARALAASAGLTRSRLLLQLGRPLTDADGTGASAPAGIRFAEFRPGLDEDALLELNAAVFRHHPEQGALDRSGFAARAAQDWFAPERLLLAWDEATGALLGYNWLKLEGGDGEVYVIGVADEAAGRGLGRRLMQEGLARLVRAGAATTSLYVEGDNDRAVGLYRSLGYGERSVDAQYRG